MSKKSKFINYVVAVVSYGIIREGEKYELLETGPDWYKIKIHGRAVYTFNWVFE